jgi:flagellar FliL protein
MAAQEKLDLGEEKKKSSKGVVLIVLGAVVGTLMVVFAALHFAGIFPPGGKPDEAHEKEADHKPTIYLALQPAFVVNFKNNPEARIAQIELSVSSTDQSILDVVKKHTPMIRNNLLLLLSGEDPSALKTSEGKEALRGRIKDAIRKVVVEQAHRKDGVDGVFFTGFVMQ